MAEATERSSALGRRIRREREALGWSRQKLAYDAGCAEPTIARIELYGQSPSLDTLDGIATALGVPVAELLEPTDQAAS